MIKESKRGQVTIFIIFGIVVVVGIILLYMLNLSPTTQISPKNDPQGYIEKCMKDALQDSIEVVLPQGGIISPINYILFNETEVRYLCHTQENRQLCTIQEPLLKSKIEAELKLDSQQKIENCFNQLAASFKNYDYSVGDTNYTITISPNQITSIVDKTVTIVKDGNEQNFRIFKYQEASPIWDMIILSSNILTQETTCNCQKETCSTDVLNLSRLNPLYELGLFITSTNEKVYTIKDTLTKQTFNFAVRNCIRLP